MPCRRAHPAASLTLVLGGGELGSAVGHGFHRAGLAVLVVDRRLPSALRFGVAFAAAVVDGHAEVAGLRAVVCHTVGQIEEAWQAGAVPVCVEEARLSLPPPRVIVDARMRQLREPRMLLGQAPVTIGIGPGFEARRDVDYAIESNRGPRLGEVLVAGCAEAHTGAAGDVLGLTEERVLRTPCAGTFVRVRALGDFVERGEVVGHVAGRSVRARLRGMVRGLKLTGVPVGTHHKVGDIDPRRDRALLTEMTDKARAVADGALRAVTLGGVLPLAVSGAALPGGAAVGRGATGAEASCPRPQDENLPCI